MLSGILSFSGHLLSLSATPASLPPYFCRTPPEGAEGGRQGSGSPGHESALGGGLSSPWDPQDCHLGTALGHVLGWKEGRSAICPCVPLSLLSGNVDERPGRLRVSSRKERAPCTPSSFLWPQGLPAACDLCALHEASRDLRKTRGSGNPGRPGRSAAATPVGVGWGSQQGLQRAWEELHSLL